jgi:hypothetical protein
MEYSVELILQTRRPITKGALIKIAEVGGVAVGRPGERHLETTLTAEADNVEQAAKQAIALVTGRITGIVVAVEVMTTAEADRRLAERPELVGTTEIAVMLGISKQRVTTLSKRHDFPMPVQTLAAGPIWRARDLSTFAMGWQRKPGRPRKTEQVSE